jgi:hypothetical protein
MISTCPRKGAGVSNEQSTSLGRGNTDQKVDERLERHVTVLRDKLSMDRVDIFILRKRFNVID